MPRIGQSSLIAFYLFAAFIVFITVRGELSTYVGFFIGGPSAPGSADLKTGGQSTATDWLTLSQNTMNSAALTGSTPTGNAASGDFSWQDGAKIAGQVAMLLI